MNYINLEIMKNAMHYINLEITMDAMDYISMEITMDAKDYINLETTMDVMNYNNLETMATEYHIKQSIMDYHIKQSVMDYHIKQLVTDYHIKQPFMNLDIVTTSRELIDNMEAKFALEDRQMHCQFHGLTFVAAHVQARVTTFRDVAVS